MFKRSSVVAAAAVLFASSGLVLAQTEKAPTTTTPAPSKQPQKKGTVPPAKIQPAVKQPGADKQAEVTLKVGDKAPALTVDKWVKGKDVKGFEKGKVYIVEFWATWCKPCRDSIPHLTQTQHDYKDITVIGIAASESKPKDGDADKRLEGLEKFVKEQGDKMDYRVAYDSKRAMSDTWMTPAGQNGIPCAFIVDGEGKIAYIGHPMEMDDAIAKLATKGKAEPKKKTDKKK